MSGDEIKAALIEEVGGLVDEEELAELGAKFAFEALMACVPPADLMKAGAKIAAGGD